MTTYSEWVRQRRCGTKARYISRAVADTAAHNVAYYLGDEMVSYYCDHCDFFHIGHDEEEGAA